MLEELLIQNFQAHGKLHLVFGPGLTTIVGPSDVGKSAIIRALRWVATNQPGGDAFVRHGSKGTTVQLVVDGRTVKRKRKAGGEINAYYLDDKEYKAFGRGVPDVIENLINMPGVCWQNQHDPSFWFGESAGEVSRQLNAIVNLGIIDTTLANIAKTYHATRTKLELVESRLAKAKADTEALAWVGGADEDLQKVEAAYGDGYAAAGRADTLRQTAAAARAHRATHEKAAETATAGQKMVQAGEAALAAAARAANLAATVAAARRAAVRADAVAPDFGPVQRAAEAYNEAANRGKALFALVRDIKTKETELCEKTKEASKAKKALPKVCPVCGQ